MIFEQPRSIHLLSLPLWAVHGVNALELARFNPDPERLQHLVRAWRSRYRNIYFVHTYSTDLCGLFLQRVEEHSFGSFEWERAYGRPPRGPEFKSLRFTISRVVLPEELQVPALPEVDVGGSDDVQVSGFYDKEGGGDHTYRWTGSCASIYVPGARPGRHRRPHRLRGTPAGVEARGGAREPGAHAARELHRGAGLRGAPARGAARACRIPSPSCASTSKGWRPANTEPGSDDVRDLGVMVDRVRMAPPRTRGLTMTGIAPKRSLVVVPDLQRARERRPPHRRAPGPGQPRRRLGGRRRQPGRHRGRGAGRDGPPPRPGGAPGPQEKGGRGAAVLAGFRKALADPRGYAYVFEMDADFSHHPREIPKFLEKLETHDMVIGSRYVEGGGTSEWGVSRPLLSWLANKYIKLVAGHPGARHHQRLSRLPPRGAGGDRLRPHQDRGVRGARRDGVPGLGQRLPPRRGADPFQEPRARRVQAQRAGDLHGGPELRPPPGPVRVPAAAQAGARPGPRRSERAHGDVLVPAVPRGRGRAVHRVHRPRGRRPRPPRGRRAPPPSRSAAAGGRAGLLPSLPLRAARPLEPLGLRAEPPPRRERARGRVSARAAGRPRPAADGGRPPARDALRRGARALGRAQRRAGGRPRAQPTAFRWW